MPVIDVHAHYAPRECLELLDAAPSPSVLTADIADLEARAQAMTAMGVDVQVLSPWFGFFASDNATARKHNDAMAAAVEGRPDRFIGLALVPMREPEQAPRELERAVRELGLHGAEIGSNVLGTNLDSKEFAPFYAKVQELDVPVFIHPVNVLGRERLASYHLDNLIGNPSDTAVAAASLVFGGVLREFPRLKFYLAHGGGSCPYLRGRWEHAWHVRPESRARIDRPPSEYLRLFYFDSLTHSTEALEFLVAWAGAERVMLGTDYPFTMADAQPVQHITASAALSQEQKQQTLSGTASALFKVGARR